MWSRSQIFCAAQAQISQPFQNVRSENVWQFFKWVATLRNACHWVNEWQTYCSGQKWVKIPQMCGSWQVCHTLTTHSLVGEFNRACVQHSHNGIFQWNFQTNSVRFLLAWATGSYKHEYCWGSHYYKPKYSCAVPFTSGVVPTYKSSGWIVYAHKWV